MPLASAPSGHADLSLVNPSLRDSACFSIWLHEGVVMCQGLCWHSGTGFWNTAPGRWVRCSLPATLVCTSRLRKVTWPMCVHVAEVLWVERFALSLQTDHPASALDLVASSLCCSQWFFENRKSDFHSFAQSQIQTPYRSGPAGPPAPTSSLLPIHFSPSLHPALSSGPQAASVYSPGTSPPTLAPFLPGLLQGFVQISLSRWGFLATGVALVHSQHTLSGTS